MEQQVSESNNGVTRLVTTLPVTKSPIANPIGAPVTSVGNVRFAPQTKQVKKIITPVMNAQSPTIKQLQPKQYQPYKAPTQISKPAPVITAVKPFPKITMQSVLTTPVTVASKVPFKAPPKTVSKPPLKRPHEDDASSTSAEKRHMLDNGSKSDKYYGFKRGKVTHNEDGDRKFRIKCFHCDSVLPNNILYMEHIQSYLDISRQSMKDSHLFCQYCFKRFKSGPDLESHFDRHHSTVNKYYCKICDYSFKSKSVLKSHLQGVHDPLSMPYVCKVCHYRTSNYQDVILHFKSVHKGAKALLCPYCCKILRCSRSYLQHCQRHYAILLKNHGTFNCPCCKLQFLSSTERNEHHQTDHKKVKLTDKDGLPPYKTIIFTKPSTKPPKVVSKKPKPAQVSVPTLTRTRTDKVIPLMECLECGGGYDNLKSHLGTKMMCSSCSYVTFCSAAFAQHTIVFHSSFKAPPKIHPVKKERLSDGQLRMTCRKCNFSTFKCPVMAWHTVSCSKGASSCESFVYLKLRQRKLFDTDDNSDKEVIEILSDGE